MPTVKRFSSQPTSDDNAESVTRVDKSSAIGPERGKRKRGRVNPTQLAHLERAYAQDRSLDASRRKEISEALGMDERQTQIWFQNRRAKAKLLEQRARFQNSSAPGASLVDSSSALGGPCAGFSGYPPAPYFPKPGELNAFLQEEDPITIIPCLDLAIGTWRRIHSTPVDLVAYTCDTRRVLTWYIHSSGIGFKMRIPYDSISCIEYYPDFNPGMGQDKAVIILNKPPTYFREVNSHATGTPQKLWRPAHDWTEGMQASVSTRHQLIGIAGQLAHSLRSLPGAATMLNGTISYPSPPLSFSSCKSSSPPSYGRMGQPSSSGSTITSGNYRLEGSRSRSGSRPTSPFSPNNVPNIDDTASSYPSSTSVCNPFPPSSEDRSTSATDFSLLPQLQNSMQMSSLQQQSGRSLSMSSRQNLPRFSHLGVGLSPGPFTPSNAGGQSHSLPSLTSTAHHSTLPHLPSINTHSSDGRLSSSSSPSGFDAGMGLNLGLLSSISQMAMETASMARINN
ncbi:uncharacterized protein EI90DRAFT_3117509 [Cantharellus anzutake]|uniref:uncharacterized protein n=1 Tax=Cantharellus anzutake TaxID=1750568 RepID=UPI001904A21D|nr:uncharacterized protein EI90DRAFT_3117509 [Cantharellus anzutake]KAF8339724.1 hypothetical protein EI90DRAFT_3117509 [Cantharellus anzutake]